MYTLEQFKIDYPKMRRKILKSEAYDSILSIFNINDTVDQILSALSLPCILYVYARYVIKNRVVEFESVIMENLEYAYLYASHVANCRIPEFEGVIGSNPKWAYYYATGVTESRIPEFEEIILRDKIYGSLYIKNIIRPALEKIWEINHA